MAADKTVRVAGRAQKAKEIDEKEPIYIDQLVQQCNAEYNLAKDVLDAKIKVWLWRLKLYNNQMRELDKTGDPLLYTIMQTVLASLYNDELDASFLGRTERSEDQADNLTELAEFDQEIMEYDQLKYDWDWDAAFFGRGLMLMHTWDRQTLTPVPELIDPTVFLRDPAATSINGNTKGAGACRYFGRFVRMTMHEMKGQPGWFDLHKLRRNANDIKSLVEQARQARAEAQNLQYQNNKKYDVEYNSEYELLEWWTTFQGHKVVVWLGNEGKLPVRFKFLPLDYWPVIDRTISPMPHDWDGVSIPDLVEDKQRMRSVMLNLMNTSFKSDVYPMYTYNQDLIKNRGDLNIDFNKFIPVQGNPEQAIAPFPRSTPNLQFAELVLQELDNAAQKATATPDIQQGIQMDTQRTLGEINMVNGNSDSRYSLMMKIFGWSEKRFWRQWYMMYKLYFKADIDEKVIRITGAYGHKWRPIRRDNIISGADPDIKIESRVLNEAKQVKDRELFNTFIQNAIQIPNSNMNMRYLLKHGAKLAGLDSEQIEQLFPPTIDEMIAEKENDEFEKGNSPSVNPNDDHITHIGIHAKANPSPFQRAHIATHRYALMQQREQQPAAPSGATPPNPSATESALPSGSSVPRGNNFGQKTTAPATAGPGLGGGVSGGGNTAP